LPALFAGAFAGDLAAGLAAGFFVDANVVVPFAYAEWMNG